MKKVVIIGAGAAGLTAAYNIHEKAKQSGQKLDYLLVEKDAYFGGKMFTEEVNGFRIESGPDCFISEKPSVVQLATKIGVEDRLLNSNENNQGTFVYSGGRLHKLPDGLMLMIPTKIIPFALSPLISWPGKLRMGLDLILPKKKGDFDETLGDFVNRRLGQEALDKIAEPLIGGIHGGNPETMSLKASFPRFLNMEQNYGSLIMAMLAARRKAPSTAPASTGKPKRTYFLSFIEGMGELSQIIGQRLDPQKVVLGKEVTRIERKAGAAGKPLYVVHVPGMEPVEADAIILAAPANNAADLLQEIDRSLVEILREIPMGSSANISVAYRKKDLPFKVDTFGFVIPAVEKRKINAVTYSSIKWNCRVPDEDHVLVRTFVGGSKNQELASLNDQEMQKLVQQEFNETLGIKADPVLFKVHRWIKGRPQYTMGHLDRVKAIEAKLEQSPGLYIAGASYRGIGVPDCVADGAKNAEDVLAYLGF